MDERISLDLNAKPVLRPRRASNAMVAARTGSADRLSAGKLVQVVAGVHKLA